MGKSINKNFLDFANQAIPKFYQIADHKEAFDEFVVDLGNFLECDRVILFKVLANRIFASCEFNKNGIKPIKSQLANLDVDWTLKWKEVFSKNEAIEINDFITFSSYFKDDKILEDDCKINNIMLAPITKGDRLLGILSIANYDENKFPSLSKELFLLTYSIAGRYAIYTQLISEIQRREETIKFLLEGSIYAYEFNVTTGYVYKDIITNDNVNLNKKLGLVPPFKFDLMMDKARENSSDKTIRMITCQELLDLYKNNERYYEVEFYNDFRDSYNRISIHLSKDIDTDCILAYVMVKDVIKLKKDEIKYEEEKRRHQLILEENLRIAEALSSSFITTQYVDLANDVTFYKKVSPRLKHVEINEPFNYTEVINNYIDEYVIEEDKGILKKGLSIEELRKVCITGNKISIHYRLKPNDLNQTHMEVYAFNCSTSLDESKVVLGILCADSIVKKEEEEKAEKRKIQKTIEVLSRDYQSISIINVKEKTINNIKLNEDIKNDKNVKQYMDYDEMVHYYILNYVKEEYRKGFDEALNIDNLVSIIEKEKRHSFQYERINRLTDERFFEAHVENASSEENEIDYLIVGFRCVDDLIAYEKERNKKLEETQIALADSLMHAQYASKAKTVFLSNMSHDIRTPMNAIIGYTTLAQEHIDEKEIVKDYLRKISVSSSHLLSLINNVLDMSRIESGKIKMDYKTYSLHKIMDDLKNIIQADIKTKHIDFNIVFKDIEHDLIKCDKLRLNQVFINCINNAIKFTSPGGEISVSVRELPTANEKQLKYRFKIKDTGIGMSEEFQKHIFEPFTREETSTVSGIQGTGLGMSITKNIVEMMNGEISVNSFLGKGTTFVISIPFEKGENEENVEEEKLDKINEEKLKNKTYENKKILLVEDNEINREIAMEILSSKGLEIEAAENGKVAIEMVESSPLNYYSLVFMDIQMPVLDGYEATKAIRKLKREDAKKIPIVAMTANAFVEDIQAALDSGMNEHIAKPIDLRKLDGVLNKYLG